IVREMFVGGMGFSEFVGLYGVARSEGLVLRYLTDAYRTLRHTVPDSMVTDELADLVSWLGEVIRPTDASLLAEWDALLNPAPETPPPAPDVLAAAGPPPVTANVRAFTAMVRNAMFRRVELASRDAVDALADLEARSAELAEPALPVVMDADAWHTALGDYWDDHDTIGIDAGARSPQLLRIDQESTVWQVRQTLADPAGDHDWGIDAEVDLAASDAIGAAVVRATALCRLD